MRKIYQTHQRISKAQEKEYTGTFTLGSTTPSYDLETEINQTFSTLHITEEKDTESSQQFIGIIEQFPPAYSALKKDGERLYEKARRGEQIKVDARQIHIHCFEITRIALPEVDFE